MISSARRVARSGFLLVALSCSFSTNVVLAEAPEKQLYKNRHGRYSFAVPLLGQFILRQDVEGTVPVTDGPQ